MTPTLKSQLLLGFLLLLGVLLRNRGGFGLRVEPGPQGFISLQSFLYRKAEVWHSDPLKKNFQ